MTEALLVGVDLEREYRTGPEVVRVLRGASVDVRAGEVVALVGASGVGKSTLMHLLGAHARAVIYDLFLQLQGERGISFFVATHNPVLARKADRGYRLVDGLAREIDPTDR